MVSETSPGWRDGNMSTNLQADLARLPLSLMPSAAVATIRLIALNGSGPSNVLVDSLQTLRSGSIEEQRSLGVMIADVLRYEQE
jgi:hypothetical protein